MMKLFRTTATSLPLLQDKLLHAQESLQSSSVQEMDLSSAPFRFSTLYSSHEELIEKIQTAKPPSLPHHECCLLFTGQGSQYPAMGSDLLKHIPFIRDHVASSLAILKCHGLDIASFFNTTNTAIHQTKYAQLSIVVLELAVAAFWTELGLEPQYAIGHSVGEIAACIHAGFYDQKQGLELLVERATRMQACPQNGTMMAVYADKETLLSLMDDAGQTYPDFAGFNSPKQTILSGPEDTIFAFQILLKSKGIKSVMLKVSHAFHSSMMQPMLVDFAKAIAPIQSSAIHAPPYVVSNIHASILQSTILTSDYWANHIRQPVNFMGSSQHVWRKGIRNFIEVGPQPVLSGLIKKSFPHEHVNCVASMSKNTFSHRTLLDAICQVDSQIQSLSMDKIAKLLESL